MNWISGLRIIIHPIPQPKPDTKVVLFTLRPFSLLLCHITIFTIYSDLKIEIRKPEQCAMEQLKLALESRFFELVYERSSRQVEVVCDAERYRQLRVRALLLEDDRDDLHTQSTRAHNHIDGLTRFNERLQEDLKVCTDNCESAQEQLRIRSREVDTMKVLANMTMVENF